MHAAYDGIGIIIRNNLHKRHRYYPNFGTVRTVNFTCDMYTNDSLHGVCFPTVLSDSEVIKLVSCSTQLNMKFKRLINTEKAKINGNFRF